MPAAERAEADVYFKDTLQSLRPGERRGGRIVQCGDMGRFANARNLLAQRRRFLVEPEAATRPIDEMEQIAKTRWRPIARAEGSTGQDCERISGAVAYAGLRQ